MGVLKEKKLLLLGGIAHASEIVKKANNMGIVTYVTDYLSDSPAKKYADKSFMVSTTDIDAIEKLCRKEKVDGIITGFIDLLLPYCCKACERLGFYFWGTEEQIGISINKKKFKQACKEYGIPIIKEYYLNSQLSGLDGLLIKYPVLVKPVDNSGSRGVYVCFNEKELKENYNKALSFSKNKEVIIEQFVEGDHVNIYYTLCDGEIFLSAMADRYVDYLDKGPPYPKGLYHPSRYLQEYMETIDPLVKNMFTGLGMKNGLIFIQGFHTNDGFKIYEMGYRLNGGGTYELIKACCGYDQLESLIGFVLTGNMGNKELLHGSTPFFKTIAFNLVLSLSQGTITKIIGIEKIRALNGVLKVLVMHSVGECLINYGTSAQIFAYVLINVKSMEQLDFIIRKTRKNVRVLDENNRNMLLDIIDISEIKLGQECYQ